MRIRVDNGLFELDVRLKDTPNAKKLVCVIMQTIHEAIEFNRLPIIDTRPQAQEDSDE